MKRLVFKMLTGAFLASFSLPSFAQDEKKEENKEVQEIVITKKGDDKEKVTVEIIGDKVTINGKSVDDYKGDNVKVRTHKYKTLEGLSRVAPLLRYHDGENYNFNWGDGNGLSLFSDVDENRAMLGVSTEKADQGAQIEEVTKKSAAEKAGLKKGDIITKIDSKKINGPDELSETIRDHKPGDKVSVTYLRDKKEQKVTAELGKWQGMSALSFSPAIPDVRVFNDRMPDVVAPRSPLGQYYIWSGGSPKLGMTVQDTDDGKGVKVIEVDEDGNAAKAGVKEDDVITQINDKSVNGADEVAKIVRENRNEVSIHLKVTRDGKQQSIEVKMPRRLKTADL